MEVLGALISSSYARRPPNARAARGRRRWLVLRRRRRAGLHAVGGLPADRRARARGRHDARRAQRARRAPDRRRPRAGRARRRDPRPPRPTPRPSSRPSPACAADACGWPPSRAPGPRSCPRRSRASASATRPSSSRSSPPSPGAGLSRLRGGEVDIALDDHRLLPARCPRTASSACTCSTTRCTSRCPRATRWPASAGLKLEDLADENWILGTTGSCPDASIFLRSCQVAGFEPRIAFNSDDYFAMQGFVAAGVGASFIPDLALMSVREDIVVRSLGPRPPVRQIMAATLQGLLPLAGQAGDARRPRRGRRRVRRQASRPRAAS